MAEGSRWQASLGWRGWLAVGLAAIVVLIVLIARIGGDNDTSSSSDRKSTSAGKSSGDDSVVTNSSAPPAPEALNVTRSFMRAWVDHPAGVSDQQWWSRLAPFAESGFAQQLKSTDPSRVPASQVTGEPTAVSSGANRAVFSVPTNTGTVLVTCVQLGGAAWRVIDLDAESTGLDGQ